MFEWFKTKNDLISQIKELKNRLSESERKEIIKVSSKTVTPEDLKFILDEWEKGANISDKYHIGEGTSKTNWKWGRSFGEAVIHGRVQPEEVVNWIELHQINRELMDEVEKLKKEASWKRRKEDFLAWRWDRIISEIRVEIAKKYANFRDMRAEIVINKLQHQAILVNNEGDGPWVTLHIENQPPIKCRLVDIEKINA